MVKAMSYHLIHQIYHCAISTSSTIETTIKSKWWSDWYSLFPNNVSILPVTFHIISQKSQEVRDGEFLCGASEEAKNRIIPHDKTCVTFPHNFPKFQDFFSAIKKPMNLPRTEKHGTYNSALEIKVFRLIVQIVSFRLGGIKKVFHPKDHTKLHACYTWDESRLARASKQNGHHSVFQCNLIFWF